MDMLCSFVFVLVYHLFLNRMVPLQDALDLIWAQQGGQADVHQSNISGIIQAFLRHRLARLAVSQKGTYTHVMMENRTG